VAVSHCMASGNSTAAGANVEADGADKVESGGTAAASSRSLLALLGTVEAAAGLRKKKSSDRCADITTRERGMLDKSS
jgi:hypothetical protein